MTPGGAGGGGGGGVKLPLLPLTAPWLGVEPDLLVLAWQQPLRLPPGHVATALNV